MSLNPSDYNFRDLWVQREWLRCAPKSDDPEVLLSGFVYFCENYWTIRHPERGRIKFEMYEAQIETVRSWLNDRYSLILKARQIGFSTLVATFSLWNAMFYSDRPILLLSRTEREAIKLLGKSKYGYQFLPEWMRFKAGPMNPTQTRMEFSNASYVESLPSASDPARGESAYLIVVDELAFLPNSDEAWAAIEPVADVGGRVIMLSTANGEGNLFHRLWVGARAGVNRFKPLFFPWSANGRDQEWYNSKSDMPEWQLAQEYPSNEDEAFLKSGRPVFNLEVLRAIETKPPLARGHLNETGAFVADGGALRVWEFPEPTGKYVIGADPSQGDIPEGDYCSVHVINARSHEVVAHWHGHIEPDLLATEVLARLGKWYNKALIGVESNNHGLTTLKFLQLQARYFPIYYDRNISRKGHPPTDKLGFRTTQVTKPVIIDDLNEALRNSMKLHDEETIAELRSFVRTDKGKMQGSPFDDRTMSLAIANHMLKFAWSADFQPRDVVTPGSWADWQKRVYGQTFTELVGSGTTGAKPNRTPIGQFAIRRP